LIVLFRKILSIDGQITTEKVCAIVTIAGIIAPVFVQDMFAIINGYLKYKDNEKGEKLVANREEFTDVKQKKAALEEKFGLKQYFVCYEQENGEYRELEKNNEPLPPNVQKLPGARGADGAYRRVYTPKFSQEEKMEYIMLMQLSYLKTLSHIATFFLVISIIGIVSGVITMLLSM
jgi:hypothetical protein